MSTPGCVDGKLVNLRVFFDSLKGSDIPQNYQATFTRIKETLWAHKIGFQTDSFGKPRGRLYIPHAGSPSCAPRNEAEKRLGVSQDPKAWEHFIDVTDDPPTMWTWNGNGGPAYLPPDCIDGTEPGNGNNDELVALIKEVRTTQLDILRALTDMVNSQTAIMEGIRLILNKPFPGIEFPDYEIRGNSTFNRLFGDVKATKKVKGDA